MARRRERLAAVDAVPYTTQPWQESDDDDERN
jgi:hypothetical protein